MRPRNETELAQMVAQADGPLSISGGGTRPIGHDVDGISLSTSDLTGITLYEPGALTLVAQAGTPVAEIEAALAAENQRLAFEPMDHRGLLGTTGTPTIGGIVAANVSGPRRVAVGACRDHLLGVRYVDGAGTVIKNGGRVMKNVTGYDIVKLMAGSYGTLGVMSEVSLKVLPQVEATSDLTLTGLSDVQAIAALSAALGSPFEVTGAAHVPGDTPRTHIRVEGFEGSVAYRAEQLVARLQPFGTATIASGKEVQDRWADIRDVGPLQTATGDIWRLSVKGTEAPALVARSGATQALYDWGGGLVWLATPQGHDLRAALGAFDGHATRVRGTGTTPAFAPEQPGIAAISAGIRARFDPRGILNPGRMG